MNVFVSMTSVKNDSIQSFARHLRNFIFKLSRADRTSTTVRLMITDICSKRLTRIWALTQPGLNSLRNDQKVEKVVQITGRVMKRDREEKKISFTSSMALSLNLSTSFNDSNFYPSFESPIEPACMNSGNTCFHCHKLGHRASRCPYKRQTSNHYARYPQKTTNAHKNCYPPNRNSRVFLPCYQKPAPKPQKPNIRTYLICSYDFYDPDEPTKSQICSLDPDQEEHELDNPVNNMERDFSNK